MTRKTEKLSPVEQRHVILMRLRETQESVAKKMNVTLSYFNKWLNGKRKSARLDKAFSTYAAKHGKRRS